MSTAPNAVRFSVDATEEVRVTGAGGAGGNVNITGINGVAPALSNPLAVELSDGTNAFGTASNPIHASISEGVGVPVLATDYLYFTYTDIFSGFTSATIEVSWIIDTPTGRVFTGQALTFTNVNTNLYAGPFGTAGKLVQVSFQNQTAAGPFQYTGACYVQCFVTSNNTNLPKSGADFQTANILFGSTLQTSYALGYPGTGVKLPPDQASHVDRLAPSNPAAGANLVYTFPRSTANGVSARIKIKSIQAVFVASAAAANRNIQFLLNDGGGNTLVQVAIPPTITASQVGIFNIAFGNAAQTTTVGTTYQFVTIPFPDVIFSAKNGGGGGYQLLIQPSQGTFQAADQIENVFILVEQWNDVD